MFVAVLAEELTGSRWLWGVAMAVGIELGMLLTPYPRVFGVPVTGTFVLPRTRSSASSWGGARSGWLRSGAWKTSPDNSEARTARMIDRRQTERVFSLPRSGRGRILLRAPTQRSIPSPHDAGVGRGRGDFKRARQLHGTSPSPQSSPRSCLAGRGSRKLRRWWVSQDAPSGRQGAIPQRGLSSESGRTVLAPETNRPQLGQTGPNCGRGRFLIRLSLRRQLDLGEG